jgi:hypothetical protein
MAQVSRSLVTWKRFFESALGRRDQLGMRSPYTRLGRPMSRIGSYQMALVAELFASVSSNEKNNPGLPDQAQDKSRSHRRSIFQTNWVPSPGAERNQSSMATGSDPSPTM